ncbi:MAG: ATP-binding protein [Mangrovibacterium sp.]
MLKFVSSLFHKSLKSDSTNGKLQLIGMYVVMSSGLIFSMFDFLFAVTGYSNDACIPGDLSLMTIFMISLLCLRNYQPMCAINATFMVPFAIYFFFISDTFAISPPHSTIRQTLWSLMAVFVFILFFNTHWKKISVFYLISLLTLTYHLFAIGRLKDITSFYWQQDEFFLNPYFILTIGWIISILFSWKFERSLYELKKKTEDTDAAISNAFRQFPQGLMVLDIKRDEANHPIGLQSIKVNRAFESVFKAGARELRNVNADLVFPKIFRNSFDWNDFFLFSNKLTTRFYLEHLKKWIELFILSNEKDRVICIFYDVSEKEEHILKLEESKKRYQVLLEAIPDLFFIIDKDGIYVDFVVKETEFIQIKPNDIIGHSIFEVGFSENMSRKIYQCILDAIEKDSIETIEYALSVEKGTAMFEMRIARLDDHSVISIARDITKRKITEMKLEEAKQRAEEADELKSAFLANISHEIRTPMNAIIGFSRMIGSPDFDNEEKERFVEIIVSNGKLLMEMVNNMISISKIESNQITVTKGICKINDLMVELYREYSMEMINKPVRLKLLAENSNPKFSLVTDKYLLSEILKKLIDNAIKFTHQGEIEFGYRMEGKEKIRFFIKDTGIGIDQSNLERIFERFLQIDHTTTRKYEGTGLGLAIARHYTELLGGAIEVKSEVNSGSEFSFWLPVEEESSILKIVR